MRDEDLQRLRVEFPKDAGADDATRLILEQLGYQPEAMFELVSELRSDLSKEVLGFGWWADHLETRERVLISDYLVGLAEQLPAALLEAWVHLSSWRQLREAEDEARSWRRVEGGWVPSPPSQLVDLLPRAEQDTQLAGFFRALGSALDVLGGLIVGVGALNTQLRKVYWGRARGMLEQDAYAAAAEAIDVDGAVGDSGPDGWDIWVIHMRNTLVHRPRRVTWIHPELLAKSSTIYLTAHPNLSEIEAMKLMGATRDTLLHEDAAETLTGVLTSLRELLSILVPRLIGLWRDRRSGEVHITQPSNQWEDESPEGSLFRGFARKRKPPKMRDGYVVMHPEQFRRLAAAGVAGDTRDAWRL